MITVQISFGTVGKQSSLIRIKNTYCIIICIHKMEIQIGRSEEI